MNTIINSICWAIAIGIIALCGYMLYKKYKSRIQIEYFQNAEPSYIKFADGDLYSKYKYNYFSPYIIHKDTKKPYLLCSIYGKQTDNSNIYSKLIKSTFNSKNIEYIFDFGIATVNSIQATPPPLYLIGYEATKFDNKINNYPTKSSTLLFIKQGYDSNTNISSVNPSLNSSYVSLSYGITAFSNVTTSGSTTLNAESRKFYDNSWSLSNTTTVITPTIQSFLSKYNNTTNFTTIITDNRQVLFSDTNISSLVNTSYVLFKNTYVTANPPDSTVDKTSSTTYNYSLWHNKATGYIYHNLTHNNNYANIKGKNPEIMKNYSVNQDFNNYMSLNFYKDLNPGVNTTSTNCIISMNGAYISTNMIENTNEDNELPLVLGDLAQAALITYKEYNINSETIRQYSTTLNSNNYVLGVDYVNKPTNDLSGNILKFYKTDNTGIPIIFSDKKINALNTADKLHNYKLPWFEFKKFIPKSQNQAYSCLRGAGNYTNYLSISSDGKLSLVPAIDSSASNAITGRMFTPNIKLLYNIFIGTDAIDKILVYLRQDLESNQYNVIEYATNKVISLKPNTNDSSLIITYEAISYNIINTDTGFSFDDINLSRFSDSNATFISYSNYIPIFNINYNPLSINNYTYCIRINNNEYLMNDNNLSSTLTTEVARFILAINPDGTPPLCFYKVNNNNTISDNVLYLDYTGTLSFMSLPYDLSNDEYINRIKNNTYFFRDKYYLFEKNILLSIETQQDNTKRLFFNDILKNPKTNIYCTQYRDSNGNITKISNFEYVKYNSIILTQPTTTIPTTTIPTTTIPTTTIPTTTIPTTTYYEQTITTYPSPQFAAKLSVTQPLQTLLSTPASTNRIQITSRKLQTVNYYEEPISTYYEEPISTYYEDPTTTYYEEPTTTYYEPTSTTDLSPQFAAQLSVTQPLQTLLSTPASTNLIQINSSKLQTDNYSAEPTSTYYEPTSTYYEEPTSTYYEEPTTTYYEEPTTTYYEPTSTYYEPTSTYYEEPTTTYYKEPTTTYYEEPTTTYYKEPTTMYLESPATTLYNYYSTNYNKINTNATLYDESLYDNTRIKQDTPTTTNYLTQPQTTVALKIGGQVGNN
jgi:hypothetical protein